MFVWEGNGARPAASTLANPPRSVDGHQAHHEAELYLEWSVTGSSNLLCLFGAGLQHAENLRLVLSDNCLR